MLRNAWPLADVGPAALAAAVWYVRPDAGVWPLLLIGLGWLARWLGSGRLIRPTVLDLPLLLFLASALAAAAIGFNQGPQWMEGPAPLWSAWAKYWYIVAGIALFYAFASLPSLAHVWRFAQLYALLATVIAVYFVVTNDWSAPGAKFDLLSQLGAALAQPLRGLPGRRLNPNVAGGMIAMLMPFFVPAWLAARGRNALLALWSGLALVALFGLLMSSSRGAWLALALTGAAWVAVWELAARRRGVAHRGAVLVLLLGLGTLAVVVALAGRADLGAVSGPSVAPLPGASLPAISTVISRLGLLQAGWTLAQDYGFTGAGLGATPWVLSTYYLLIPVYFTAHVHNMFLDVLIEQGILGFMAFVVALGLAVALALRSLFMPALALLPGAPGAADSAVAGRMRLLLAASLASIAVMVLHGQVDDVPYGSRALILMFVPFGIIVAARVTGSLRPARRKRVPRSVWRAAALGVALLALLLAWQRSMVVAAAYANLGALAQTQAELGPYRLPDRLPEEERRSADLSIALNRFARALALDPGNRTAGQRLGEIALARGEYEPARDYLETVYRADPASEVNRQLLGDAYLALGRADDAFALWSGVPNAPAKLELEALLRFEPQNDLDRARQARELAARIRAELARSQQN